MEEKIGVVLTNRTETTIMGYLGTVKVQPALDDFFHIIINMNIEKINFKLNYEQKKLGVLTGTLKEAYAVAEELKKAGYEVLEMIHEETTYSML